MVKKFFRLSLVTIILSTGSFLIYFFVSITYCKDVLIKTYRTPVSEIVVNQYIMYSCESGVPYATVIKVDNGERETQQVFIDNKAYTNTDFIETRYGNFYNPNTLLITVYLEANDLSHVFWSQLDDEEEGINISFTTREEENRIKLLNEE